MAATGWTRSTAAPARIRFKGGAGSDILTGGAHADKFVFQGSFGTDELTDFDINQKGEKIRLDSAGEAGTFEEFVAASRQVGSDIIYDAFADNHNMLILRNVALDDLTLLTLSSADHAPSGVT